MPLALALAWNAWATPFPNVWLSWRTKTVLIGLNVLPWANLNALLWSMATAAGPW